MKTNKLKKGKLCRYDYNGAIYKYHGIGKDGRHYFTPVSGNNGFGLYDKDSVLNSDKIKGRFSLYNTLGFARYRNRPILASMINTIKKFFNK